MDLRAIPRRLWAALAALGFLVLAAGWSIVTSGPGVGNLILLGVSATVLYHLPRGHPFAHQCAYYVAFLVLCTGVAMTTVAFVEPGGLVPGLLVLVAGLLFAWGLSGRVVSRYFNLHCVACGSYEIYQRGMLFKQIGCRKCRREWKAGEILDPSIFE
ncbi:MAG: hypothetical protein ACYTG3_14530 [Planctomycetota bacterium]